MPDESFRMIQGTFGRGKMENPGPGISLISMRDNFCTLARASKAFGCAVHSIRLVFLLVLLTSASAISAQDEKQKDDSKFELSKLDTFLKNKDGTLIQYFNITFEEFERVYNALSSQTTPDSSDLYSIRTAKVVAKVRSQSAAIELELNVLPKKDGVIDIPLGMNSAFFPLAEKSLIRRNKQFFVRLDGKADKSETIKLRAVQNVKLDRDRKQLALDLPSATFTTVQVHELESDFVFSVDQDSISKSITPLFSGGTAYEFAGIKDTAVVSWSKRNRDLKGMLGTVSRNVSLNATVGQDEIRYEAVFSVQSTDPLGKLKIGLPKKTIEATVNQSSGMVLNKGSEQQAWMIYELELGRQATSFDDIRIQWKVRRTERTMNLVGFEVMGFELSDGQLTVRSDDNVSFVLANRFNIEQQDLVVPNRHQTYTFSNSIFSASVFTIMDSPENLKRADLNLKLDSTTLSLDIELPSDLIPENPASVAIQLDGWKLTPGQNNLVVDKLLQQVQVSPIFFLSETQTRRISFNMNLDKFGERNIGFPKIENLDLDQFKLSISATDEVMAKVDRNQNPDLQFASQFETEIVSVGRNLVLTVGNQTPLKVKLRLDPVVPFVEASRNLRMIESEGDFFLESTSTIESSREFDSVAAVFHSDVESIKIDGKPLEQIGLVLDEPFLMQLGDPSAKVVIDCRFRLGTWRDSAPLSKTLTQFYLPTVSNSRDLPSQAREIQGRNFGLVECDSTLSVVTSTGLLVVPDIEWQRIRSEVEGYESSYRGAKAQTLELTKSMLADEDVHVEQAWVHTSLNRDFRQDRVAIRFVPKSSVVNWQIPEGTRLVSCRLDGRPLSSAVSANEGPIETKFAKLFDEHVIEFDLRFFNSSFENQLKVRLPKTSRVLWCQEFYWSLQLPDSHYVLDYSNELSSSYRLNWTGFFLRPTPNLSLTQLERWAGAERQNLVDHRGNDYLFSTFGIVEDRSVFIVSKRNLVLVFGLIFISLGCAFVSLSFMRNSIFLVSLAAGILILGMWYPIWFVQLLQIEIFIGFLFGVGFVVSRFTNWINPAKAETRIETNVPSLVLAAPDSGVEQSADTRGHAEIGSEGDR